MPKKPTTPTTKTSEPEVASVTPITAAPTLVTVDRFIRSLKGDDAAFGSAFARVESLKGKTVRKSMADWRKDFDAFMSQPRW